jgi:perosamine synthetase
MWKIPLFKTYSDDKDIQAVTDIIRRGTYWALGQEIIDFEEKIAKYLGVKYALTFNSGTSALHSVLLAYNVAGGEVIVPSFTFIATSNTVLLAGATPVFAESETETFGLIAEDVEKKITPKTKAIMPIHYGGCPARDIEKIKAIAEKHKILLIEDAAQSLGTSINGKKVGTFGDSAMFSFCQNKVVACGEGGVVVTNSEYIYEKMKLIRSHGRVEIVGADYFSSIKDNDYIEAGYNFRMPTIIAALGISQLDKIDFLKEKRIERAAFFINELKDVKGIRCPIPAKNSEHIYQMFTLLVDDTEKRDGVMNYLKENGIMSKVYFEPIHLKTLYRKYGYKEGDLPLTEDLSKHVLTLPFYIQITDEEIKLMTSLIKKYFEN